MCGVRQNDLSFWCASASSRNEKFEPFGGEKRHVTAENEIPLGEGIGGGGMLQRGNNAAERPFARPAILYDFEVVFEAGVSLSAGNYGNFRGAAFREFDDFQQQRCCAEANEGLVATKARTGAAREKVSA